jgi:putative ABC transport system ATP-binding protein
MPPIDDTQEMAAPGDAASTAEPLVAIRGLTKYYVRGGQVIPVLVGINLDVYVGDYIALMGPSGSRSPRCQSVAGSMAEPGEIRQVAGEQPVRLARSRAPKCRLHLPVLQPDAGADRVRQRRAAAAPDVVVAPRSARASRPRWRSWVSLIAWSTPERALGGQQQRVAIACALITDSTIVVADSRPATSTLDRDPSCWIA